MVKALTLATTIFCAVLCMGLSATPPSDLVNGTGGRASAEAIQLRETIEKLITILNREYFDPELAARVSAALQEHISTGRYQEARSPDLLAKVLTEDLYAWTGDKHLVVSPIHPTAAAPPSGSTSDETDRHEEARRANFGIQCIEVFSGNIGYLNLTAFYRPSETREALASAMAILRHADALIVDLRHNGGGSSQTLALFASYFFDTQDLELFQVVLRPPAKPLKFLTETAALPDRNAQRPMYILTSGDTWSGGEGFAAIMQDRHRAAVVGQRTAGAGNQARPFSLGSQLEVVVSNGRAGRRLGSGAGRGPA